MQENWVVSELMEGERNVCEMALEPVFRVEGSERRERGGKGERLGYIRQRSPKLGTSCLC